MDVYNCSKVAVFSDIHSNYHALKACFLDALKAGADGFVFLGDYVSGLSEPMKTMDLVYEIRSNYPTACIRGNRERYMLEHRSGANVLKKDPFTGAHLFTYDQLRECDLDFFKALPFYDKICLGGITLEIAHATKHKDRVFFLNNDPIIQTVYDSMDGAYMLLGHSHKPYVETNRGKMILNPGAVGLPEAGDGKAQYALLDVSGERMTCKLCRVAYDFLPVIHAQFHNGLMDYAPYWAVSDLYSTITGTPYTRELTIQIREHMKKDPSAGDDLQLWHKTAEGLGLCFTEEEFIKLAKKQK